MESREEEEVVRRWKTEMIGSEREEEDEGKERDRRRGIRTGMIEAGTEEMVEQFVTVAPKKKRRMIGGVENDAVEDLEVYEEEMPVAGRRKRKGRG